MSAIELHPTPCAICQTFGQADEIYAANFDHKAFNPEIFSARRLPDRIHYRIVKCQTCGLVRSDPIASLEVLAKLYTQSQFTYNTEIANLQKTYGRYLNKLGRYHSTPGSLLEIGCGNGFFLREALRQGYQPVLGIEPSQDAVQKADRDIQAYLRCQMMEPGVLKAEQFDVICMFQVLDHIVDPQILLKECFRVLKPGGMVLCLNHNIKAYSAQILGRRSPIIDIEHTYLYDPDTMNQLFLAQGFQQKESGPVYNQYSLSYLVRLLPLPNSIRSLFLQGLIRLSIDKFSIPVPLGNLYFIAQKPLC